MKNSISDVQKQIRVETHGEDYGSWMSNPVFYVFGGIALVALVLAVLSFSVFKLTALGIVFAVAFVVLLALLGWMAWIRRQYAFGKGGMMEKIHQTILSSLAFDGKGSLLEVGCGSGALSVRAALTWPEAKITGLDYWGAMYNYSQALCEKNVASEGVGTQCTFVHGDANRLDFPDESFDAVISNYVYHNIMGADKHALLLESLRVLKKGGVFVLHDSMKPQMYGDMNAFAEKLRGMGFAEVRYAETAEAIFGSKSRAAMMMLGNSAMLVGRKYQAVYQPCERCFSASALAAENDGLPVGNGEIDALYPAGGDVRLVSEGSIPDLYHENHLLPRVSTKPAIHRRNITMS